MSRLVLIALLVALVPLGCVGSKGVYHTVQEGQTLYRISRVYGVEETYLARINGIPDPTQLSVGKRLYIPGATAVKKVPRTVFPPTKVAPPKPIQSPKQIAKVKPPVAKGPTAKKSQEPPPKVTASATPKKKGPPPAEAKKDKFHWPLKGQVTKRFGGMSGKSRCKGIEIKTLAGTPVHASAAGHVIYSGNGIKGYGNLIIIQHEDSFFTVYGYNKKNLKKTGSFVSKGEKIALAGVPPGGGFPRLHFEIRYGKESVNPMSYLP